MKRENNSEKKKMRISQVLMRVIGEEKRSTITYKNLVECLGDQAFGFIVILFALPSLLPVSIIPGFSFLFSLPILVVAFHLIMGKQVLWLPHYLAAKEIDSRRLDLIINKTVPYLEKIEHLLKPRWLLLTSKGMERLNGLLLMILSIFLTLPIPLSNLIFAILIVFLGLGLIEKDGLMITLSYLGMVALLLIFTQVTHAIIKMF